MAAYDYDLGILGGGAAGLSAAAGAAQFGAKTILVDMAKKPGGGPVGAELAQAFARRDLEEGGRMNAKKGVLILFDKRST